MSMKRDLVQLARITDAAFQAAQSELAVAKAREVELRATLKSLEQSRSDRAEAILDQADTCLLYTSPSPRD